MGDSSGYCRDTLSTIYDFVVDTTLRRYRHPESERALTLGPLPCIQSSRRPQHAAAAGAHTSGAILS